MLAAKIGETLLNLSVIIESHAISSRYPDLDLDFDPDEFYSDTLPLICHLDEIQDAIEKCLLDIEMFVSITDSKN